MLVALVRHLQMEATSLSPEAGPRPTPDLTRAVFERDRRFGIFATNIYFASLQLTKSGRASAMEVDQDQIIFSWLTDSDEQHCPKFMVILDHESSSVVLVIRGTFCFKDILMDVVCEEVDFQDGAVHSGFLSGSEMVLAKARTVLENALREYLGYRLVVCGHSMGGSVAIMLTLHLLQDQSQEILPPGVELSCVALGSAPVFRGRAGLSLSPLYRERIRLYINERDVVPRLSLGSVAKLLVLLRQIDNLGLTLDQQLAVVMWRKDDDTTNIRDRLKMVASSVQQDQFEFLHHPGVVTRLASCQEDIVLVEQTEPEAQSLAENLEIFETMINDHLHTAYRVSLNKGRFQNKSIANFLNLTFKNAQTLKGVKGELPELDTF